MHTNNETGIINLHVKFMNNMESKMKIIGKWKHITIRNEQDQQS